MSTPDATAPTPEEMELAVRLWAAIRLGRDLDESQILAIVGNALRAYGDRRAAEAAAELVAALKGIADMADDELRRLGAVPGSFIAQIEADARAALARYEART